MRGPSQSDDQICQRLRLHKYGEGRATNDLSGGMESNGYWKLQWLYILDLLIERWPNVWGQHCVPFVKLTQEFDRDSDGWKTCIQLRCRTCFVHGVTYSIKQRPSVRQCILRKDLVDKEGPAQCASGLGAASIGMIDGSAYELGKWTEHPKVKAEADAKAKV